MQKFVRIEIRFPLDEKQFPNPMAVEAIADCIEETLTSAIYEIEGVVIKSFVLTEEQETELYETGETS